MVLDSDNFLLSTKLVWFIGTCEILLEVQILLGLLVCSVALGKISRAPVFQVFGSKTIM